MENVLEINSLPALFVNINEIIVKTHGGLRTRLLRCSPARFGLYITRHVCWFWSWINPMNDVAVVLLLVKVCRIW